MAQQFVSKPLWAMVTLRRYFVPKGLETGLERKKTQKGKGIVSKWQETVKDGCIYLRQRRILGLDFQTMKYTKWE